jgi:single-stranded-DNA-specific exonuclease
MPQTSFLWIPRGIPFSHDQTSGNSSFPPILKHLITQRNIPEDRIDSFLNPRLRDLSDPFLIPDMLPAVERILEAIDLNQSICIFGDYDVDGISSITLMTKVLSSYGLHTRPFIPKRGSEGYGLSSAAIQRCLSEGPKPDLLIAVDCGTVSFNEIEYLRSQNIDTVIIDHHEPSPQGKPDCHALVNPKCGDQFTYLCAAGVAFKVAHALLKTRPTTLELKHLLDLVATATIADIVPLIGENRILVRHGLIQLHQTTNPGLRALQQVTSLNGIPTSSDIGFRIGPRINAAGRMDAPEDALALLNTDCPTTATQLAQKLDSYNRQRQSLETTIRKEAYTQLSNNPDTVNDPVIVIGSRSWHHGVVGIVASRLMREYYKPTFVISFDSEGIGKGSGRSIEGISLVDAIRSCSDTLIAGGGHAMAAGLSLHENNLPSFRDKFSEFVLQNTSPQDRIPRLHYDAAIPLSELSLDFLKSYELLQPFGNGNPQPTFIATNLLPSRPHFTMKNNHLRLFLQQHDTEHEAVFFGAGETPLPPPPWDIAFTINRNTFRNNTSLQITIQNLRSSP